MEAAVNGYKGLNQDSAYDSISKEFYIDALDMRVTTVDGQSQGAITNIKGNKFFFSLIPKLPQGSPSPYVGTMEIIGVATIRNEIILFTADDSVSTGYISSLTYDETDKTFSDLKLIYSNPGLYFSKAHPIKAIGRYESGCIQRVYWTDYNNFLRSINIKDPLVANLDMGQIDIYPDVEYKQMYLTAISGGGALLNGEYQATYRLTTEDGKQTLIAPPGNLIHLVSDSETLIQSAQYTGDLYSVNTGKSISITVDTTEYGAFEKIELIMIFHNEYLGTPEIFLVEEAELAGTTEVTFLYTGTETTATLLTLDEYTIKTNPFKTCKTLAAKDNSLIIANIKGSTLTIDDLLEDGDTFNAKTKRYNSASSTEELNGVPLSDLDLAFNESYNRDDQWQFNWHEYRQFKYQNNGARLGGQGPNVSYTFHLEEFTIDGLNDPGFVNLGPDPLGEVHNLGDGSVYDHNSTYPNMASPFISGLLRGYKRGETYRFGIVFYTKKGESSFVEYIGDIKFPDISEKDSVANASGYRYFPTSIDFGANGVKGYAMGVKFNIDFTSCPSLLNNIESYQIVRLKRTESDTRRASQGIMKNFWQSKIGNDTQGFDLRVGTVDNTLHLYPFNPDQADPSSEALKTFNGVFTNLDTQLAYDNATGAGNQYVIRGDAASFISPEISYNWNSMRDKASSLSNNPALLITGAYSKFTQTQVPATNLGPEGLGDFNNDIRTTFKNCIPVKFGSKDNIRRFSEVETSSMSDSTIYTDGNATTAELSDFKSVVYQPNDEEFYLRNYYAIPQIMLDSGIGFARLNEPTGGQTGYEYSRFYKGASSILGKLKLYTDSPIEDGDYVWNTNVNEDWFRLDEVFPLQLDMVTPWADPSTVIPIMDLVFPKAEVYGGYSQAVLESNTFIAASPIIDKTFINPKVYGGDIFLCMFTVQTSVLSLEEEFFGDGVYAGGISTSQAMVTESLMNLDLSAGSTIQRGVRYDYNNNAQTLLRQETSNSWTEFGKTISMYAYRDTYSIENDEIGFFVNPETASSACNENDTRAYISNVKINDEEIDSWTQFGALNYYDVDDYGPINEILNWRDEIFFCQDKAIGKYSINPRAIVSAQDGIPTELGSGEGFQDHAYLSTEHGSIHQWAFKSTDSGIYYFDGIHKKIFHITEGNNPLSEVKGMHSFVNALKGDILARKEHGGDNPILRKGVHITRDKVNDEVLFTFLGNDTDGKIVNTTLVYDELMQHFVSFYSAAPSIYIENGDILLSPDPTNPEAIYQHNTGDYGRIYGDIKEASVTLVLNDKADVNKILRTLEFNSIVRDNNKIIDREQTITAFQIKTEYQDTGKVLFSTGRIKRKWDKWRVKIPRDQNNGGTDRLRSTRFVLTLYFDNTYNKELILNRIIHYYNIQIF